MNNELILNLIPAILLAFASGMVGVFALMRRMSLAADAMSHIALPGLGLAFLYGINPLIGGAATLLLGALLIWKMEGKTKIPTETIIGVVFSLSLAIGSLVTPKEDLIDALFGGVSGFSLGIFVATSILALVIIAAVLFLKNKFILQMISPDLATVAGLKNNFLNLCFLLIFAATIILGLNFLGALLTGSLIIIPAAAAKNMSWNINSMLLIAALVAAFSVGTGMFLSFKLGLVLGPTVIILAGVIFFLSLVFRKS
ncbi:MAG: metal ABC transporter permease [Candidatus Wolfebacteria bacterium]|nr:metal ABC transporter permease [Candidatus Wolfebacteria bacterium]